MTLLIARKLFMVMAIQIHSGVLNCKTKTVAVELRKWSSRGRQAGRRDQDTTGLVVKLSFCV